MSGPVIALRFIAFLVVLAVLSPLAVPLFLVLVAWELAIGGDP